jgi:hypothetical protein
MNLHRRFPFSCIQHNKQHIPIVLGIWPIGKAIERPLLFKTAELEYSFEKTCD